MNEEINKIINWIQKGYVRLNYKEELTIIKYIEQLQQENQLLKDRINKAIEYMKPRFMNCIDNEKRYFEDNDIQQIYEILKGVE